MTQRRSTRPSQVRPRPPSSGRPKTAPPRPRPTSSRVSTRPAPSPGRQRLPLPARGLLTAGLVALGVVVALVAVGGIGRVGGALGAALGGFVDRVTATATPSPSPIVGLDPPQLDGPADPYTSQPTVTLTGTLPTGAQSLPDGRIRILVSIAGGPSKVAKEIAIPPTAVFTVPALRLAPGQNDFTATLVAGDAQSDPSAVVTYVLDTEAPAVTVATPKSGATVNRATVEVKGTTQPLSGLLARNAANGATATGKADGDGAFTLVVPIAPGSNAITVTATDPAGNTATGQVTVIRGSGKLTADISASDYRLRARSLPQPLTIRVVVTDPDGLPLAGAQVLFTITMPGLAPIVPSAISTDGNGTASFATTIPKGATPGTGLVTARVTTTDYGELPVRTVITIVR